MASFPVPTGRPTLSEVALCLSAPRTHLGTVTRADVLEAVNCHSLIDVRENRIDGSWVTTLYFVLAKSRGLVA